MGEGIENISDPGLPPPMTMTTPHTTRRQALKLAGAAALGAALRLRTQPRVFDVRDYGARGDGVTLDTAAIQKAIDAAAASAGQVLLRGGKKYLVSTLVLKGAIDLHLRGMREDGDPIPEPTAVAAGFVDTAGLSGGPS